VSGRVNLQARAGLIEHFHLKTPPGSPTSNGAYYSVDYGNAHFIVLNTNETSWTYSDFSRAQAKWLKADAAAARARGAWLIVLMHKGPYTTSAHATDGDIKGWRGVRARVAPLLEKLDADLVLQGHDHIYARTKPIKENGTAAASSKRTEVFNGRKIEYEVAPKGTIYLIPATAGPKTYYRNKKLSADFYRLFELADENHAAAYGPEGSRGRSVSGQIQNFTVITIDGAKLTAVSYEINQSSNNARPYIIDQFGIVKEQAPRQ
jgi:3',5'-cyclic AMP phosphodiesterase CpdA